MRFCLVSNWFPPENFAGSGIYLYHLAAALAGAGHAVTVLYDRDAYRYKSRGLRQEGLPALAGVRVVALQSGWGALAPVVCEVTGRPLLQRRALADFFRREFDVIHFSNVSLLGGPASFAYGNGIKLAHLHDYWLLCPKSHLFQFRRRVCRVRHCLACSLFSGQPPQLWRRGGHMARSLAPVDAFIANSDHVRAAHLAIAGDKPIVTIPYLLAGRCPDASVARPWDGPFFLCAGRLERVKGVQSLLSHFRGGEFGTLLVAGDGSFRRQLERAAGPSPFIRFLGHLSQLQLEPYYRHARALLVPSLNDEPFGIVAADALGGGLPVIVRDAAGPGELVRRSGAGLTYSSPGELRTALQRLVADDALRRELGARGRAYFAREFTAAVHLERYLGLIEGLRRQR